MTIDLRVGTGSLPLITPRQRPMGGLVLPLLLLLLPHSRHSDSLFASSSLSSSGRRLPSCIAPRRLSGRVAVTAAGSSPRTNADLEAKNRRR